MRLYLVQHGQATTKEDNPERPLTEAGRTIVESVAGRLAAAKAAPVARIWHSGKRRSAETAELLAGRLHPPLGVRNADGLAPNDDPKVWRDQLEAMTHDVMLVGHLPHLARLVGLLLTGDETSQPVQFHNAGVVCLSQQDGGWRLDWSLPPSLLMAEGA
ncbi:MAG TPA: phosphohistidine phosphatase SixA [Anaerolineales bacterium]|jgi:phosphohistidine phosphatase